MSNSMYQTWVCSSSHRNRYRNSQLSIMAWQSHSLQKI